MIRNVLAPGVGGGGGGHATSWQPAPQNTALIFDYVTCIYHQEIGHVQVYKVNC